MTKQLIQNTEGVITLVTGITMKEIGEARTLFIRSLREIGKKADEISVAYALTLTSQQAWIDGQKGHTQGIQEWMLALYEHNKSFYERVSRFYRDALGMSFKVVRDDDDKMVCDVELVKNRDLGGLKAGLGERLRVAIVDGLTFHPDAKVTPPKRTKSAKGKGENGDAVTIDPRMVLAEKAGILDAFTDEESATAISEYAELLSMLMEHIKTNPNREVVKTQLENAVNKLNNGFKLGAAMAKAG